MSIVERYGDPGAKLVVSNPVIDLQVAHRAVRKFTDRQITDDELAAIVAAAQSAATSSNLQAWSVIAVRDPGRKARLAELCGNQKFIERCPVFLVWIADLSRAQRLADRAGKPLDGADYIESTILGFVDAALAAQNAMLAAESLGFGGVYVGGARNHPDKVAAELDLPPRAVATFGMALGEPDPTEEAGVKPRLPLDTVLFHETYDTSKDALIDEYDARATAYNARFGMAGNWSDRVVSRLAGAKSLGTRDVLREQLDQRGFPSR